MDKAEINSKFSHLIRNKLTEEQFWEWVSGWKDGDDICREAENWDIQLKKEEIGEIKRKYIK